MGTRGHLWAHIKYWSARRNQCKKHDISRWACCVLEFYLQLSLNRDWRLCIDFPRHNRLWNKKEDVPFKWIYLNELLDIMPMPSSVFIDLSPLPPSPLSGWFVAIRCAVTTSETILFVHYEFTQPFPWLLHYTVHGILTRLISHVRHCDNNVMYIGFSEKDIKTTLYAYRSKLNQNTIYSVILYIKS